MTTLKCWEKVWQSILNYGLICYRVNTVNKRARALQIYSLLRTARLNVLYYESSLRFWNYAIRTHDVLVALASASSPIAYLKRSTNPLLQQGWFYLTLAGAILGTMKPILRLDKQVSLYSELVTHYRDLFSELKCVAEDMTTQRDLSAALEKKYISCRSKEGDLQKKEPPPNNRKIKKLQLVVEAEYDMNKVWLPAEEEDE